LQIIATITQIDSITKILRHVKLSTDPPRITSALPRQETFGWVIEDAERKQRVRLDAVRKQKREAEEERQRRIFTELDCYTDPPPEPFRKPLSQYVRLFREYHHEILQIVDPTI
jgi:hypothetical protein